MTKSYPSEVPDPCPSSLRARPIAIDTLGENVVFLPRDCRVIRPEHVRGIRKIELRRAGRSILASVMIVDDAAVVSAGEIGLAQPAQRRLGAAVGDLVEVTIARSPASLDAVRAKVRGEVLSDEAMTAIVGDLAARRYLDMEIAAFLVACASFMTTDEVLALTHAMVEAGTRLQWPATMVVDKHSIGGIPGNRTTPILTAIVAAHGLTIPKTSSRAITSPAGTADTMEVLARVDLNETEMRAVVDRCSGCVVWGGHVNLSPADDVLISVERPLELDTPEQMVASILSKKAAAGSTHLLIDIPVGATAKIRSTAYAQRVRKLFEFVGTRLGLTLEILLTDGSQPIGRGVGPVLEARDVLAVLAGDVDAPVDLREKSIAMAGRLLEFDPELRGGMGESRARELLESGSARRTFERIIAAQGPSPIRNAVGDLTFEVTAEQSGSVERIDCFRVARIARLSGAPTDPGAGVDLFKRVGDRVKAGEPTYRIHAEEPVDFGLAREAAGMDSGFKIA